MKQYIHILLIVAASLAYLGTFAACNEVQAAEQATAEPAATKKVLRHVVAFTFKDGVSAEDQAAAIENFASLEEEIPEILSFEGGEDTSVEGFTKGFTHCFILTFADEAGRDTYLPHPGHMRVVKENKPLMKDLLVLDVWGEE